MARINPKLNLNRTPQNVDNTSLIFAKNIKLSKELSIVPDSAIDEIQYWENSNEYTKIVGKIVGINARIYFFTESNIYEYKELTNTTDRINCGWAYHGGEITGCVTVNNTGEYILTICEYNATEDVPIKHINLSNCSEDDDESIYTQAPNIPITNLNLIDYYTCNIPNGVYQFFIRYKIRDNFYTNWFHASKECFAGNTNRVNTIQGQLKYTDLSRDASESFIFSVEHLYPVYSALYSEFQIGFLLSNDNGTFARKWKHFSMNTFTINFSYESTDIEEENIDDLLKVNYELFNVKNILSYKNKLYIGNYKETDFNNNLYDDRINIDIKSLAIADIERPNLYLDNHVLIKDNSEYWTHIDTVDVSNTIEQKVYGNSQYCILDFIEQTEDNTGIIGTIPKVVVENDIVIESNDRQIPVTTHDYREKGDILLIYFVIDNVLYHLPIYLAEEIEDIPNIINHAYGSGPAGVIPINELAKIGDSYISMGSSVKIQYDNIAQNFRIVVADQSDNYSEKVVSEYYIIYSEIKQSNKREHINASIQVYVYDEDGHIHYEPQTYTTITATRTTRIFKRVCSLDSTLIKETHNSLIPGTNIPNANTLMPFTGYDFYVHYVKQNGVITNGSFIGTVKTDNGTLYYFEEITFEQFSRETQPQYIGPNQIHRGPGLPDADGTYLYAVIIDRDNHPISYHKLVSSRAYNVIQYPTFSRIFKTSADYAAAFISIVKTENEVCQGFNHYIFDSNGDYVDPTASGFNPDLDYFHTIDCIEADILLFNVLDNIRVLSQNGSVITTEAKYYASGETENIRHFGTAGFIGWTGPYLDNNTQYNPDADHITYYVSISRNTVTRDNNRLIKLTPYIKLRDNVPSSYNDYANLNIPGYITYVEKPRRYINEGGQNVGADGRFVSGTDIFTKNYDDNTNNLTIDLYEGKVRVFGENINIIHSNYNLNYLNITKLITPYSRSYTEGDESKTQMIASIDSMTSSSIYDLAPMYRSYQRKTYTSVEDAKMVVFNNTVRSSNIDTDEVYRSIYRFEAEDYYNVPTNRGIIINMFSIVNKIYVHCEHALFVFTDTNMMKVGENLYTSNNTEVALQKSSPFDIGIQELFDSEFGYGGLQNKKHSLVTYNSYIFYDKLAKTIYAFGGDSQLIPISDAIYKIINWLDPTDILFAADNINNRFFINLRKAYNAGTEEEIDIQYKNVCLSYNFASKSFVSIHDMDFDDSFNSRINTYFETITNNNSHIYKIDNNEINNYKQLKKISELKLSDADNLTFSEYFNVANVIDIICNTEYEKVKVLNWINWICKENTNYHTDEDINVAEENGKKYSGHFLRIYSDETYSALLSLTNDENEPLIANNVRLSVENGHYNPGLRQYPRYNCGVWSMNDFRDIKNINANKEQGAPDRPVISDNMSLLYGKYFVVRFIFKDKNFKFENIKFNMGDYEKS